MGRNVGGRRKGRKNRVGERGGEGRRTVEEKNAEGIEWKADETGRKAEGR